MHQYQEILNLAHEKAPFIFHVEKKAKIEAFHSEEGKEKICVLLFDTQRFRSMKSVQILQKTKLQKIILF